MKRFKQLRTPPHKHVYKPSKSGMLRHTSSGKEIGVEYCETCGKEREFYTATGKTRTR